MKKHKIITDFLGMIGAEREAQRYLKLFHRGNPAQFAVIKIGGAVLEQSMDVIAMNLAYLSNLDLFPIVIHGGGPQIDRALDEKVLPYEKIDGQRVTTKAQVRLISRIMQGLNIDLAKAITRHRGKAVSVTERIFQVNKHPDDRFKYVGSVTSVNLNPAVQAVKNKKIPIISCLGYDTKNQVYNINADSAAKALVLALRPKKYLLITEQGGIRDKNWKILSNLNLVDEFEDLERKNVLRNGMLHKIREIKDLLEQIDHNLPVQVTSSRGLLQELFTDKGNGTYIKLGGNIREYQGYNGIDRMRLKRLLEKSFNKTLRPDYFDRPVGCIIMDKKYRGVAVMRKISGMYYLDKFCVRKETRGEGVASDLWRHVEKLKAKVFWRSRPANPVNIWYFQKADGVLKYDNWFLYFMNLDDHDLKIAREYVLLQEESFAD